MAKGPFMEFLRARVTQPTMNLYEELQMPTPTSKTENMAMLIHSVEFIPSTLTAVAPAANDFIYLHLSKASQTTIKTIEDPDTIAAYQVITVINATLLAITELGEKTHKFDPPILYPKSQLYVGLMTNGMAAAKYGDVRVGYTLEKVSREDFISALVE